MQTPATTDWSARALTLLVVLALLPPGAVTCWRLGAEVLAGMRLDDKDALHRLANERFPCRDGIRNLVARSRLALGVSGGGPVAVGREGMLYHASDIAVLRDPRLLPPARLEGVADWFAANRAHAVANGAGYLVAQVPAKSWALPDQLPAWAVPCPPSPLERWGAGLSARGVPWVDLRSALADPAAGTPAFQRLDTHWHDLGAYQAYRAIISAAQPLCPGLGGPIPREACEEGLERRTDGDLARLLGLPGRMEEEIPFLRPPGTAGGKPESHHLPQVTLGSGDPSQPSAVLLRDSFGVRLIPFLAPHFRRLTCAWVFGNPYLPRLIEAEKPDLVIHELSERCAADPTFWEQLAKARRERRALRP